MGAGFPVAPGNGEGIALKADNAYMDR